jgi:hypothetical protein
MRADDAELVRVGGNRSGQRARNRRDTAIETEFAER